MDKRLLDVVIIGGGPGGLSTALVLGRSRRTVVLIDDGKPRNAVTHLSHGFLTRDGVKPFELRNIAREQLKQYKTISLYDDYVQTVQYEENGFQTITRNGEHFVSRKVLFATGLKEELPPIPGLDEIYGTSVFPCPYCDGWEHRDQPLAVIGNGEKLLNYTKMIHHWSKDLVVCTNGPASITQQEKQELTHHHIRLVESPIRELMSRGGQLNQIILQSGESIKRSVGFLLDTGAKQATMIPQQLGIKLDELGSFETKGHGTTNVKGLFIIGDAAKRFTGLIGAASEGYAAGVVLNHELVEEDWTSF